MESGPDADTPRPCGLALLLCMRDRGPESTDAALIGYASRLQVSMTSSACLIACAAPQCEPGTIAALQRLLYPQCI